MASIGFSVDIDTGYSSVESIFSFLKLNFLYPMLGEENVNEFKYLTNFSDTATLDYVMNGKDKENIPPPSEEEIDDRLSKKFSIYEIQNMDSTQLAAEKERCKNEYYYDFRTDKDTSENKFTKPAKFLSYKINPIYEQTNWTTDKLGGSVARTIFEDNVFDFRLVTDYNKFELNFNFQFKSKTSAFDMSKLLFNKINLNRYFYVTPDFIHKIRIPDPFVTLMKLWYNMDSKEEVVDYIYKISKYNVVVERDVIKNDYKSLFLKYVTDPLFKFNSIDYNEDSKSVVLNGVLELSLPSKLVAMTHITKELLDAQMIKKKYINVTNVIDLLDEKYADFLKFIINEDTNIEVFRTLAYQYGILFDKVNEIEENLDEFIQEVHNFIDSNDYKQNKEWFILVIPYLDIDLVEYIRNFDPDTLAYKIIKFDLETVSKLKDELELTDEDIEDIKNQLNVIVIDTELLTEEEVDFIREYNENEYKLFHLIGRFNSLEEELATYTEKGENFSEENYDLIRTIYYQDEMAKVTKLQITDEIIVINLEHNYFDIKMKVFIDGKETNDFKYYKDKEDGKWYMEFYRNVSANFIELNVFKKKG